MNAPSNATRPSRTFALICVLIGFVLWLAALDQHNVWVDELSTINVLNAPDLSRLLQNVAVAERRPPLYFVLLWLWSSVSGAHEFALRYFSLCFLMLALALMFPFAREVSYLAVPKLKALPFLAVFLTLSSPVLALYGVMIRYYSLLLCLALMLSLIFLRWLRVSQSRQPVRNGESRAAPTAGGRRHRHSDDAARDESLTLYSTMIIASMVQQYEGLTRLRLQRQQLILMSGWLIVALLLIYTDYSVLALIGAQSLWLSLQRRSLNQLMPRWLVLLGALALCFVPLIYSLRTQVGRDLIEADLARGPLGVALKIAYPFFSFAFGETILPWHPAILLALPLLALALIRSLRARRLLAFAAVQSALPLLFNVFITTTLASDIPFLNMASRTLFAFPFFVVAFIAGVVAMPTRWRTATITLLVLANLLALLNLFNGDQYHNPIYAVPLRLVADSIRRDSQPRDVLLSDGDIAFHYYWQQQPAVDTQLFVTDDLERAKTSIPAERAPRVWLLSFGRERSRVLDRSEEIQRWLAPTYGLADERGFVPIDPIYRALKEWLLGRESYSYKLMVRLFVRK